jgi:CBS domain-containing protein
MIVSELMERGVVSCHPGENLETAARLMWDNNCGSVLVIDESAVPVGIITDRDIAMSCVLNHKAPWDLQVSDVTNNRPLHTCGEDEDIKHVLTTLQVNRIRRLPVVNGAGGLLGIVSIDDIIAHAGEEAPDLSFRDTMGMLKAVCIQQPH